MHTLNPNHVGKTLAITVGILYILCAIAYVVVPKVTTDLFVYMFHGLNVKSLLTPIEFLPTIIGLVVTLVYSYIAGAIFAVVWNRFTSPSINQ